MPDFIFRNKIVEKKDLRNQVFERADARFSSFLEINIAYAKIKNGGTFTGNGWEFCNLFGLILEDVTAEMDSFRRCSMGNMEFFKTRFICVRFRECALQGSLWKKTRLEECRFEDCNLRGAQFPDSGLENVLFRNCTFEDTNLENAAMNKVRFEKCTFYGAEKMCRTGRWFLDCRFEE